MLASSLAFVDGSIVNACFLPLGAAVGDRFGRKRSLIAGTALFALASRGCAPVERQRRTWGR